MAIGDLTVTEAEHEFLKAFVVILEHLKNRATKAERENVNLLQELTALREKVEYLTAIGAADPADLMAETGYDPHRDM
jgi:hypothetical protein